MPPTDPLARRTTDELEARLRTMRGVQYAVSGIFALIILAWIVLGYWTRNVPVFISTVVMALGLSMIMMFSRRPLVAELRRRKTKLERRES